jgi:hypothetical protein
MGEVERLRALAKGAAFGVSDVPGELARLIRLSSDGRIDPWMLAGVLLEGAAHVIRTAIPVERRQDAAAASVRLLAQRVGLNSAGRAARPPAAKRATP